jgi:hypothetical protein
VFEKGDCQCCSIFLPSCLVAVPSPPVPQRYRAFEERASTGGGSRAKVDPDTIYNRFANRCSALEHAGSPQRAATGLFGTHAWFAGQGVNQHHVGKGHTSRAAKMARSRIAKVCCAGLRTVHPQTQTVSVQMMQQHRFSRYHNLQTVTQTSLEGRWDVRRGSTIKVG